MNSSGIKRGLASSAIAALAVAGLPLLASSANAVALNNGFAAGSVVFANANANPSTLSIKADGTDSTVRLEAIGASDVTSLAFEYSINGGTAWVPIGTATADDGAFSYEWAPPASIVGVAGLQIRALANGGTTAAATLTNQVISASASSTNITAGSALGVFQTPYGAGDQNVILSGTSSNTTPVTVTAAGATANFTPTTPSGSSTSVWSGVLNISAYSYGANDQLLVKSSAAAASGEDFESFSLYKQVITTVTATPAATTVPSPGSTTVTVTVKDQNGNPIAGARTGVVGSNATTLTDAKGQATFTQNGGSTAAYYADATAQNGFDAAVGDKKSADVTVNQYVAAPTTLAGKSADGNYDFNEYAAGDLTVQVKDQNGSNLDTTGQTLQYYWVVTPFNGGAAVRTPLATATPNFATASEVGGLFPVDPPANLAGTYELYAALTADGLGNGAIASSKVLTFKAGNAAITFAPNGKTQAVAGGTASATGTLALEDGTPLPGRTVDVTYSSAGNAGIVQANGTSAGSRSYVTGTDGTFKVDVKDPVATPQPAENGTLAANTNPDIITAAPDASEAVEFANSLTPAQVSVVSAPNSTQTAGLTKSYTFRVDADSDSTTAGVQAQALANTDVTLTLDHGFFTPNTLTPATTPAAGDDAYNLKNLGTSITVKTNASGEVTVTTTIAKDAGFDDDGFVDAKITATAGSVSANDTDTWTSANPLNGGTAAIDLAPAAFQDSTVLPDARNDQDVAFDVYVTDQFGNKVPSELVNIKGTGSLAGYNQNIVTDVAVDGDFTANAQALGAGDLTVTWVADTNKYAGTPLTITGGTETLTDAQAVSFYAYDINTATLTLDDDASGTAPVGQAVTETAKVVDSKGQPVQGVAVAFLRQGPGGVTDGDPNLTVNTNAKGEAYYSFTGTSAGTAKISAVFSDNTGRKTLTDSVAITGGSAPTAIKVTLTGDDNGAKDDRLVVTTTGKAAGADITIYKVKKNGKRGGVVATATVNNSGTTKVTVPDTNGKGATKYVAVVSATSDTKAGTSNKKTVK